MNTTIVTDHAKKRITQRVGGHRKSAQRISDRAFNFGLRYENADRDTKLWMDEHCHSEINVNDLRLYGKHLYIFSDNILVTVLPS